MHKARIDVDKERTEAAAVTAIDMAPGAARPPPLVVRIDRPFIFLIRDRPTDTILFLGRVMDPSRE